MSRVIVKSQKPVFTASHFTVQEAQVVQGAEERTFHHIVMVPFVYVLPLTSNNELYLLKHHRYVYNSYFIEVVAGIIEKDEEPLISAKRELAEEAGLRANDWFKLAKIETASNFIKNTKYYFLARDLQEGKQKLEFSEDIEVIKMPIEDAVEKIYSGEINAEKSITGILLVYTLLQKGKI